MKKEIELNLKLNTKWMIAISVIISFFAIWKVYSNYKESKKNASKVKEETKKSNKFNISSQILQNYPITTANLIERNLEDEVTLPGKFSYDLENLAEIGSRTKGRITNVFVKEGDNVKVGTSLVSISSVELAQEAEKYLKGITRQDTVKLQAQRAKELYDQKIISAKEYEVSVMEYKHIQTEVNTGYTNLQLYGFTSGEIELLRQGKIQYQNIVLRSPIQGTITYRNAVIGQSINPDDKLFTVANLSKLWIFLEVYEKDLGSLKVGAEAELSSLSQPNDIVKAKVAHVGEVIDASTHTAKIRLEVPNEDLKFKPGQTVNAKVKGLVSVDPGKVIYVVPSEAVHKIEGENIVFTKSEDGSFEAKQVEVGKAIGTDIEIKSGLDKKDLVVVGNSFVIKSEYLK